MKTALMLVMLVVSVSFVFYMIHWNFPVNRPEPPPPTPVIETPESNELPVFDLAQLPIVVLHAGTDIHIQIPINQHYHGGMQLVIRTQENCIILESNEQIRTFCIDTKGEIGIYYSEIKEERLWILDAHIR